MRDQQPCGERAGGDQRLAQGDRADRLQPGAAITGSAEMFPAVACRRASSRAPRRAA